MHMTISLLEALVGFEREISHLDGRVVKVTRSKVTKPRQVISLANEGMPRMSGGYGYLRIKFSVLFPSELTDEQREGFQQLSF